MSAYIISQGQKLILIPSYTLYLRSKKSNSPIVTNNASLYVTENIPIPGIKVLKLLLCL